MPEWVNRAGSALCQPLPIYPINRQYQTGRVSRFDTSIGSRAAPVASRSALVNDIEVKLGVKEVRNGGLNLPKMCWT